MPGGAAALEDLGAAVRAQAQAQGRWRHALRRLQRAVQHRQRATGFGGQLQAPQDLRVVLVRPQQHCGAGTAAQQLFRGPRRILLRRDHEAARERQAGLRQRRRVQRIRRRDEAEPAIRRREPHQRRQHQAQLAQASLRAADLGQRAQRPAAAGQGRIEHAAAAGHGRRGGVRFAAAPDVAACEHRVERRRKGARVAFACKSHSGTPRRPDFFFFRGIHAAPPSWRSTPTTSPSSTSASRRKSTSIGANSGLAGRRRTRSPWRS